MSSKAHDEYSRVQTGTDKRSVQRQTHLRRFFEEFCSDFRHRLNDEQFKKEGDFSDGVGGRVAIWAFKAWQFRLYGAVLTVDGSRCFVGVTVDPEKKSNRADQALLRSAALEIAKLEEYHGAKSKSGENHGEKKHQARDPRRRR